MGVYVRTKRRKYGRKFSIRHTQKKEEIRKCLEIITNLNTQSKDIIEEEYNTYFSVILKRIIVTQNRPRGKERNRLEITTRDHMKKKTKIILIIL
jgi:hypothetical protein